MYQYEMHPCTYTLLADTDIAALKDSSGTVDILFLVFHGGSTLVSQLDKVNKTLDFQALQKHLRNVTELHYHSAIGRVALRLVPCPSICNSAHKTLCQVKVVTRNPACCYVGNGGS